MIDQILFFVGRAICHQLEDRSFVIDNKVLPLCARCTGIYLGIFSSLLFIAATKRHKANMIPNVIHSLILLLFILTVAFDGLSSYLHLRESNNALRLITGTLYGISLPLLLIPLLRYNAQNPNRIRIINAWTDMLMPLSIAGALGLLVYYDAIPYYIVSPLLIVTLVGWCTLLVWMAVRKIKFIQSRLIRLQAALALSLVLLSSMSVAAEVIFDYLGIA